MDHLRCGRHRAALLLWRQRVQHRTYCRCQPVHQRPLCNSSRIPHFPGIQQRQGHFLGAASAEHISVRLVHSIPAKQRLAMDLPPSETAAFGKSTGACDDSAGCQACTGTTH